MEAALTKEAASLVTETTWHPTQQVRRHKDGSVGLLFRVNGPDEIVWWVLGWSGRAQVIKPQQLRDMVVEQLQAAVQMNQP